MTTNGNEQSRRAFIKTGTLLYVAPAILTLSAKPAFAQQGSPQGQNRGGGPKGNNGVGNGIDPPPPGNDGRNDVPGTGRGNPGNQGGGGGRGRGGM